MKNKNKTVTKADIVRAICDKTEHGKAFSAKVTDTVLSLIKAHLQKGRAVQLSGFGAFHIRKKKRRQGRNPRTGARVKIPGGKSVSFRFSGSFLKKF